MFSRPNGEPMAATPHLEARGVADFHDRQVLRLDFQHRDVGAPIQADHLGVELALVGEFDDDVGGVGSHVGVGENDAVGADDETGTLAALHRLFPLPLRRSEAAEELEHRVVFRDTWERRLNAGRSFVRHADVDHRRPVLFDDPGEIGELLCCRRGVLQLAALCAGMGGRRARHGNRVIGCDQRGQNPGDGKPPDSLAGKHRGLLKCNAGGTPALCEVEIHDTSDQPGASEFSIFSDRGVTPIPPAREKNRGKTQGQEAWLTGSRLPAATPRI